ncbi:MAG TPA: hypothetical protein ENJ28_04130 [Gammaproteobacteria bacterium]|nr:hypothetical protein [Gammaproteobacteria bacterium]
MVYLRLILAVLLFTSASSIFAECDDDFEDCPEESSMEDSLNSPSIDMSQFVHTNKNAFSFKVLDIRLQKYPYRGFCSEIKFGKYCSGVDLDYEKYVGMKGVFISKNLAKRGGRKEIREVLLENGEKYYFGYFSKFGAYSRSSPLVQLKKLFKLKAMVGKPYYAHLSVTSISDDNTYTTLSNGLTYETRIIKPIKILLKRFKSKKKIDKLAALLQKKFVKTDKFTGDVKIAQFGTRKHTLSSEIIVSNDKLIFLPKLYYRSPDWLFIHGYTFRYGEKIYKSGKIKFYRDHAAGTIWEWTKIIANKKDIKLFSEIASSDEVAIRFHGKQYYSDKNISEEEISNIKEMLELYKYLGGK